MARGKGQIAVLLNVNQVCARLGVSRRTVYNWIKLGKLARQNTPGGQARFDEADLLRFTERDMGGRPRLADLSRVG